MKHAQDTARKNPTTITDEIFNDNQQCSTNSPKYSSLINNATSAKLIYNVTVLPILNPRPGEVKKPKLKYVECGTFNN